MIWEHLIMDNEQEKYDWVRKLAKVVLIVLAVVLSVQVLTSTTDFFATLIFLIVAWSIGSFFYRKRKFFSEWSHTQKPLKQYLAERRAQEIYENTEEFVQSMISRSKRNALDSVYDRPLSESEDKVWTDIITRISDND